MMLRALMEGLAVWPAGGGGAAVGDVRICDLTEDSRTVMPGSLFVARKGEKADGNAYIAAAIAAGAVAVLSDDPGATLPGGAGGGAGNGGGVALLHSDQVPAVVAEMAERFFGHPSRRLDVVGITGTKGKTTCAYLVHQLLRGAGRRCGLIGTVCIDDGVEVAPAQLTTPPALEVSRTLARMVEAGCTAAVMETSSHALDQGRVAALRLRAGVFTNLGHDHLDYHKTVEAYADAKARLFAMLPASGLAVVNADDPATPRMTAACRCGVVGVSLRARVSPSTPAAACAGRVIEQGPWGSRVHVVAPFTPDHGAELLVPLIGPHNVYNALQAACVAHALGVEPAVLMGLLPLLAAPPGRMQPVTAPDAPLSVYVDYAHTPDSLAAVLSVARQAVEAAGPRAGRGTPGRVIVVFGCGGDRDTTKRPLMGAHAAAMADVVVLTSDNPRTEDPLSILRQIVSGVPAAHSGKVRTEPDRAAAILSAVNAAEPGDVVLIAGKGHEDYQIIADGSSRTGVRKVHFDDREQAIAALHGRGIASAPFEPGALLPPAPTLHHGSAHPRASADALVRHNVQHAAATPESRRRSHG